MRYTSGSKFQSCTLPLPTTVKLRYPWLALPVVLSASPACCLHLQAYVAQISRSTSLAFGSTTTLLVTGDQTIFSIIPNKVAAAKLRASLADSSCRHSEGACNILEGCMRPDIQHAGHTEETTQQQSRTLIPGQPSSPSSARLHCASATQPASCPLR